MVDPERLARLLRSVSDDVGRLERHASAAPADVLGDDVRLDHVKYRFVTAIEAVVDTAHHVCATEGLRSPATNADAVRELAEHGVLPRDLADEVARAVGFRNVLVHRYAEVVDEHVVEQLGRLEALRQFVRAVSERYL